jgi:long-subunit acyl-CoA synthetase (AMP-forming)
VTTLSCGVRQRYTNVASLKSDLADVKPDALITVPLVLGTLYGRVMAGLAAAGGLRAAVATFLLAAGAMHGRVVCSFE